MKDLVIVKSKTINNESVPVIINVINPKTGENDSREITRSVIFTNFKAEIPLKWAETLIKMNPEEFSIVKAKGKLDKEKERKVRVAQEKLQGYKCQYCGAEPKSKAGLSAHIRFNHPDKWEGKKN